MLYFLFLVLALLWSASFIAIKISIVAFSPLFCAMVRVGIALLSLTLLFSCSRTPLKLPLRTILLLWMQGIIAQGMAFVFLFWGEQYISPALASIINSTVPLWVLLINGLILREQGTFTVKKITGLAIGFVGILLIFGPMLAIKKDMMTLLGAMSVTGMAVSYAVGAILYQKLFAQKKSINFKASIWHQHVGSFVFLFLFSLCSGAWPSMNTVFPLSDSSYEALWAIVYLGVFSTAFAWIIYSHLIVQWGAVRAVTVLYVVPIFAILWDMLFLHLSMSYLEISGVALILLGVLSVQGNKNKNH